MIVNSMVSVIVPLYNCYEYIPQLIDSLRKQTYRNYEVIIVDDGSTDGSLELLKRLTRGVNHFIVFSKKNEGQSIAREFGFSKSTGELITFVDGDDYVSPDHLKTLVDALFSTDSTVAMVNSFQFGSRFKKKRVINGLLPGVRNNDVFLNEWLKGDIPGFLWNKIFFRTFFTPGDFEDNNNFMEDVRLLTNKASKIHRFCYVDRSTYFYRQREDSAVHGSFKRAEWLAMKSTMQCLRKIIRNASDEYEWENRYIKSYYFLLRGTSQRDYEQNIDFVHEAINVRFLSIFRNGLFKENLFLILSRNRTTFKFFKGVLKL